MKVIKRIDAPDLKERLKQARSESGVSVAELCYQCEFSSSYWYSLLNVEGEQTISFETLQAIGNVLGVDDCFGVACS